MVFLIKMLRFIEVVSGVCRGEGEREPGNGPVSHLPTISSPTMSAKAT